MTTDPDPQTASGRSASLDRVLAGTHDAPFSILGPHPLDGAGHVTAFVPGAARLTVTAADARAELIPDAERPGIFAGPFEQTGPYRLEAHGADGARWTVDDPYRFGPSLDEAVLAQFETGAPERLWQCLGAHPITHEGVDGTRFAVWAPHARRVSVVGPFNFWDGRRHVMRRRTGGVWEIFLPGVGAGETYKYELIGADGALLPPKADPVGFASERPPANASVIAEPSGHAWADDHWMETRAGRNARTTPISIYEVHLPSWRRGADGRPLSWAEAADQLVPYAVEMGFTHLELMPIAEHPFDGSWGYQPVGLFAPTARHGEPDGLRALVDAAHRAGLGVILDWVPGHFPTDPHGLGRFDGTPLYEYDDPRQGFHPEWNTLIYDYGSPQVTGFLTSNALYWLEEFHVDGLRVDAVASMLYRDYARPAGEWVPNADGGRENYEAIDFLKRVNRALPPGAQTLAEESTAFPGVTKAQDQGGLGFGYKWNMGWMHDTLEYMKTDPARRPERHHTVTFGLTYAFDETFVLPISHDEVSPGRGSMLGRMPGDGAARFANLRAYYAFMWGHPGKKLLFMGQEFAQPEEWNHDGALDWDVAEMPAHDGVRRLIRDLNALYRETPALHYRDADPGGFQWIEADATGPSVYSWLRRGGPDDAEVAVLCNFGASAQPNWRTGLPQAGRWREALNTDADIYGGSGLGNLGAVHAEPHPHQGQPASTEVMLPPFSAIFLIREP
ncbi:1,4-alpha-glucan branching protein GlgB [Jannaschia seohaensis]|uniref:1,4-alpha-glucan branching enzyme GlgB n=1 Tax=Jannaschia seohaensis TaxID=475081 RepID=A0A2Y9AZD1_9RHOB|nr:1,4-alpha-glucan branching protein GlgB [Jannaschia seohaensis]PWJ15813.1 1,4-alpha-glucan branching enzyme [Jannaschia seohaensis]SSA49506.1 1,4-alpha-glucan branching enzyme [Jannaschia seohaensis]